MQHTPGPWADDDLRLFEQAHTALELAVYGTRPGPEVLAAIDALRNRIGIGRQRLAAPELLAALIAMEAEKSDYMRINSLGDPAVERTNKQARAAIAKATGLTEG